MDNNMDDEFCLKWNSHHSTFMTVLHELLQKEVLVDVTLAAEGKFIEAHRLVLCTCSNYFQDALSTHTNKHAFMFLNNVAYEDLRALVDYMYKGEVNVAQDQLPRFLATADALKIKGLCDRADASPDDNNPPSTKSKGNNPVRKKHSRTVSSSSSAKASSTTIPNASPSHQLLNQSIELHEDADTQTQSQNESSPRSLNEDLSTPDDNFIAVDAQDELDQTEDDAVGIGTLGRVWSLHQTEGVEWDQGASLLGESSVDTSGYSAHDSANMMDFQQDIGTVKLEEFSPGPSSAKRRQFTSPTLTSSASSIGKQGPASGSEISYSAGKVSCPTCGRCYSQKGSLNRHLKYECSIVPKFPCPYCPLRFRRAYKLTEHHARFHAHEGPLPPLNNGGRTKT